MSIPQRINIRFQQRDKQDSQKTDNDKFCRIPITSAQSSIGTEKHPDACILLNYDDDDCSQG